MSAADVVLHGACLLDLVMKLTEKKFLNLHQTLGPLNGVTVNGQSSGSLSKMANTQTEEEMAIKTADKLLVSAWRRERACVRVSVCVSVCVCWGVTMMRQDPFS